MNVSRHDMPHDDGENSHPSPLLISVDEVATILKCSIRTVWRMDSAGHLPSPVRISGLVRWRYQELIAWIEQGCPSTAKKGK